MPRSATSRLLGARKSSQSRFLPWRSETGSRKPYASSAVAIPWSGAAATIDPPNKHSVLVQFFMDRCRHGRLSDPGHAGQGKELRPLHQTIHDLVEQLAMCAHQDEASRLRRFQDTRLAELN